MITLIIKTANTIFRVLVRSRQELEVLGLVRTPIEQGTELTRANRRSTHEQGLHLDGSVMLVVNAHPQRVRCKRRGVRSCRVRHTDRVEIEDAPSRLCLCRTFAERLCLCSNSHQCVYETQMLQRVYGVLCLTHLGVITMLLQECRSLVPTWLAGLSLDINIDFCKIRNAISQTPLCMSR